MLRDILILPVWFPVASSCRLLTMPRIQPKPTRTTSGGWQLRIMVPKALREAGFMDGAYEYRKTCGPCTKVEADAWAAGHYASFIQARRRFEDQESGSFTPEVIEEYQSLVRRGSYDDKAADAASGWFEQLLEQRLRASGIRPSANIPNLWDAIAAEPGGQDVIDDLDRLAGNVIDFEAHIERWLVLLKVSEKTAKMYASDVAEYLNEVPAQVAFVRETVVDWHERQLLAGLISAKTIDRKLTALKGFHKHLVEKGLIDRDGPLGRPFEGIVTQNKRAAKTSTETRAWSDEEITALYSAARKKKNSQLADVMALAMFTGSRIEALYQLRAENIDLQTKTMMLGASGDKTAAGKDRLLPIATAIMPLIERLLEPLADPRSFLLPVRHRNANRSHGTVKAFSNLKSQLFPDSQREATFHSFRQSFISKMANEVEAPEHFTADMVGHENNKSMTMGLYRGRARPEEIRPYLERLHYKGWTLD